MADESDDYEGLWAKYFDSKQDVELPNGDTFRAYRAGSKGPHIVLLHGGGYTSMTWCLVAALLKENYTVHAFDLRGHGQTHTSQDDDLAMETLVQDTLQVLDRVLPPTISAHDKADGDATIENPQTVIVGHSLGGALAVRVAATSKVPSLVGVMVIDVVEGTALASLKHMGVILEKRPSRFRSYKDAIHWALHSGMVRNAEAADVSIPSQLRTLEDGSLVWKTDLASNWFLGLSEQFLALKEAKILVLAGSDRLDTALVRGQMMGKFEMRIMYGSGHAIQEDCPDQVATAIMEFSSRCARTISGSIFGANGAVRQPNKDQILAERLAKARAMVPKEGIQHE
ncbi:Protein phosphatase methylesterase 1 [Phytophthora boehmeriae]|uniref:Protein phosphatase methylesterase 1 n=1 Tax=Phytophthora boehmeriae TaxID=109152 RepID=A0A8T1WVT4_9STRA|nr:Protein phosphatase methylesterase 1 [Phytophthora boehmeriae]